MKTRVFEVLLPNGKEVKSDGEYVDIVDGCLVFKGNIFDKDTGEYILVTLESYAAGSWHYVGDMGTDV